MKIYDKENYDYVIDVITSGNFNVDSMADVARSINNREGTEQKMVVQCFYDAFNIVDRVVG